MFQRRLKLKCLLKGYKTLGKSLCTWIIGGHLQLQWNWNKTRMDTGRLRDSLKVEIYIADHLWGLEVSWDLHFNSISVSVIICMKTEICLKCKQSTIILSMPNRNGNFNANNNNIIIITTRTVCTLVGKSEFYILPSTDKYSIHHRLYPNGCVPKQSRYYPIRSLAIGA